MSQSPVHRSIRCGLLPAALALSPLFISSGAAAETPTVAVVKPDAESADGQLATAFSESLTSELGALRLYRMVERSQIAKVLHEQALADAGVVAESSAARMGELLGAQKLVVGRLSRVDRVWQVDLRLLDATTGTVDRTASTQCNLSASLVVCARQLASELAGVVTLVADAQAIKRVAYDLAATLVRQMPPLRTRVTAASATGTVQASVPIGNKAFAQQRLALHPDPQQFPGEPARGQCVITNAEAGTASASCEASLRPARGEELRSLPLAVTVRGGSPALAEAVARQLVGKMGFAAPGTKLATPVTLSLEVGDGGVGQRRVIANLTAGDDGTVVFSAESMTKL